MMASGYKNPLRALRNLVAERIDMGVDYSGSGPIYALGPGVITNVYNSGWPGGVFIGERLTKGPLAGRYVYAAEDITPSVTVGQKVNANTKIGDVNGGIETGFAAPPGLGDASGASQWNNVNSTAYGVAYDNILVALGAPHGVENPPVQGKVPASLGAGPWVGIGRCGPRGMGTRFSYGQLEGLWIDAGGSAGKAPLMAAIAMAESGGCSTAANPSGATGLWQILGAVRSEDQGRLEDPQVNAKEAVLKLRLQGLHAWTTYSNGAYKQFYKANVPPITGVGPPPRGTSPSPDSSADCLLSSPKLFGVLGGSCFFRKSEARALLGGTVMVGGAGVLAVGLLILIAYGLRSTKAGEKAGGAAGKALEAGGAVLTVAGVPEAGAPLAAAGSRVKSHASKGSGKRASTKRAPRTSQAVSGPQAA